MSKELFAGLPAKMREKMSIKILASFWKFLEHEFAQDNTKSVGELMGEIELEIAEKGYNLHEVLNE